MEVNRKTLCTFVLGNDIRIMILTPAEWATACLASILFLVQTYCYIAYYYSPVRQEKARKKGETACSDIQPPVSIIIYAKNDAEYLNRYLPVVLEQQYPDYEVIVVNDGSTDDTKDVLSQLEYTYPHLYQTYIPDDARNLSRRKLALTIGMKAAKHEIVLLTDANCIPQSEKWIAAMVRNFTPETDIVLGHSFVSSSEENRYRSFDRELFALHYLSFALKGKPYMGIGTNLSYRKHLFFKNKGFSRFLNLHFGDDDLFINQIATPTNTKVELSPESQIKVLYDHDKAAWKEKKLRYMFTAGYLKSSSKIIFGMERLSVYLFYAVWVAMVCKGIQQPMWLIPAGVLFALRTGVQIFTYNKASDILHGRRLYLSLIAFDILYTPVNIWYKAVGFLSRKKNFTWV